MSSVFVGRSKKWTRLSEYVMESGCWRVTKSMVGGKPKYSVWRSNAVAGYVDSFAAAQELIDQLENANAA